MRTNPGNPGFVVSADPAIIRPIFRGIQLMLNGLWLGFFVVAMVSALAQWLVGGNAGIFAAMVESIFAMAKLSVEVMVLLFGTLTLWLGFLRIAEKAGIVEWLAKALGPCSVA
jgi:spore maturation protein SpmA